MYAQRASRLAGAVVWTNTPAGDGPGRVLPDGCMNLLRAAALAAHRPGAAEADRLLPSAEPAPATPVERGDLPPFGDGAPDNHVDVGG